jgi:hypothetical protein
VKGFYKIPIESKHHTVTGLNLDGYRQVRISVTYVVVVLFLTQCISNFIIFFRFLIDVKIFLPTVDYLFLDIITIILQLFVSVKAINGADLSSVSTSNGVYISYLSQGRPPLSHIGVIDMTDGEHVDM